MASKLLPLSVSELCAHALELERDAGQRYREYAARMHELGASKVAAAFNAMRREQDAEVHELEQAAGERKPAELSPWEYVWRLTYMPEGMEQHPRVVPLNAREALQLAAAAKRRAQAFYKDVAQRAQGSSVRSCAAEMASAESRQIRRLERLLGAELRQEQELATAEDDDATLPPERT